MFAACVRVYLHVQLFVCLLACWVVCLLLLACLLASFFLGGSLFGWSARLLRWCSLVVRFSVEGALLNRIEGKSKGHSKPALAGGQPEACAALQRSKTGNALLRSKAKGRASLSTLSMRLASSSSFFMCAFSPDDLRLGLDGGFDQSSFSRLFTPLTSVLGIAGDLGDCRLPSLLAQMSRPAFSHDDTDLS